jgi:hypothetical protein
MLYLEQANVLKQTPCCIACAIKSTDYEEFTAQQFAVRRTVPYSETLQQHT